MILFAILSILLPGIAAHSWMTCPKSFVTSNGRGGYQGVPCEPENNVHSTSVWAGDRLKVGWTSNNHAGGYVRLSLVKYNDHKGASAEENFQNNVLKYVCYGHDQTKGINNGDCIHPCNGRPGCEYQADNYDIERYDTTIKIPTNLDGIYVLQAALMLGNSQHPYFSCAKLIISNGNTGLNCQSNEPPLVYSCLKSGAGVELEGHYLREGAKRGDFCYRFDGTIGGIDDDLRTPPINVECDPRLTCDNSVRADICHNEAPTMKYITGGNQPGCSALYTVPPALPTCYDEKQNGDELGVDCGGEFCNTCPPAPPKPTVAPFSSVIRQENSYSTDGSSAVFKVIVTPDRDISNTNQCWQLILQYEHPIAISSSWGMGELVHRNNQDTIFIFERFEWSQNLEEGKEYSVSFSATNPQFAIPTDDEEQNKLIVVWDDFTTALQGATKLQVYDDKSQCLKVFTTTAPVKKR